MAKKLDNDSRESMEISIAKSMLFYDKETLGEFINFWREVEKTPDLLPTGQFNLFMEYMKDFYWKSSEEDYSRSKIISYLKMVSDSEISEKVSSVFKVWLMEIIEDAPESDFELADSLMKHYMWLLHKEQIRKVDEDKSLSFDEKLRYRPVTDIGISTDNQIGTKLSEIVDDEDFIEYATYINDLDQYITPSSSNLMVIGARPSNGKSTLMLHNAVQMALDGIKVVFISLEMNKVQIKRKVLSWVIKQKIGPDDHDKMKKALKDPKFKVIDENLTLVSNYSNNAPTIFNVMKDFIDKDNTEVFFIDYLQLMSYPKMDEWASLRKVTFSLKKFSTEHNKLIVTCSQVSRSSEDLGITMGSMYGSSSIEADADILISISQGDKNRLSYESEKICYIEILKNREGEPGHKIEVAVDFSTMDFKN